MKNFRIESMPNKPIVWWINRRNKIDWHPPYQRRGKIWSDTDKAYLIDSIINGYDIPKIYMADFTFANSRLNRKNLPYAIIDGKQRFEAIFDFYDGKISLNDDFVYMDDTNLDLGGMGYKDLKGSYPEIAEEFEVYNLTVISVYSTDPEQINNLFVRLNRSKPLTGAEIRNAMTGKTPEIVRNICKHDFFTNNIKFQVLRGADLNAAYKILMFEYYEDFKDTTKKRLDQFVTESNKGKSSKLELATRRVIDVLEDMSSIFLPKDKLLNSAGIIPVYYWLIRNAKAKNLTFIRKFLITFEMERTLNRKQVKQNVSSSNVNLLLVEYDNWNRSTNNEQSHKERYLILDKLFKRWLLSGKIRTSR